MPLIRLLRRRRPAPTAPTEAGIGREDRSALLRELEVSVPAPERLVRWDDAAPRRRGRAPLARPRAG